MEPTTEEVTHQVSEFFITRAFQEGGLLMYFIAAVGVYTIYLVIKRLSKLRAYTVDKDDFNEHLFGMVVRGDVQQAISYCDAKKAPLTNTLKSGLVQVLNKRPDEEVQVAMDAAYVRETPEVDGDTGLLAVCGNIATLLGLTGTIIGMIMSFRGVSEADGAKKAELLSRGISEALNCTAFGLLVAMVAIIAYGYIQIKNGKLLNDVQESSMRFMNLVTSNRDKLK